MNRRILLALLGLLATFSSPAMGASAPAPVTGESSSFLGLRFLGTEYDKSSADVIYVQSVNGWVPVAKNQQVWVQVPSNRFAWLSCGETEWTTAPDCTRWVLVTRNCDRDIVWYCYAEC